MDQNGFLLPSQTELLDDLYQKQPACCDRLSLCRSCRLPQNCESRATNFLRTGRKGIARVPGFVSRVWKSFFSNPKMSPLVEIHQKIDVALWQNQAIGLRTMKLTKMFFFKHPSRKRTIGFQLLPGRGLAISLLKDAYTIPHISALTYCMYTLCTYFYRWRVCITTIFLCNPVIYVRIL